MARRRRRKIDRGEPEATPAEEVPAEAGKGPEGNEKKAEGGAPKEPEEGQEAKGKKPKRKWLKGREGKKERKEKKEKKGREEKQEKKEKKAEKPAREKEEVEEEEEEEPEGEDSKSQPQDEDEIEIDFSKLKKIFTKSPAEKREARESEEEAEEDLEAIEFDVKKVGQFIVKNRRLAAFLVLLSIFAFSFYVRMIPAKHMLLSAYDPYFWYRYAKYFLEGGFHFPEIDVFSYYPPGRVPFENIVGWPAMEAFFFLLVKRFIPGFTVMEAAKILPAVFGGATVFPAYIIGRKAGGRYGGLFSAFLVGTSPAILTRTVAGFADTDACVMFFTLAVVAMYAVTISSLDKYKLTSKALLMSILGGIVYAIFALTWASSSYILNIILAFPFLLFAFYIIFASGSFSKRILNSFNKVKVIALLTLLFFLVGTFTSFAILDKSIAGGFVGTGNQIKSFVKVIVDFSSINALKADTTTTGMTGQSNVFISVAEMQAPDWGHYTSSLRSSIYYALMFFSFGPAFLIFRYVKTDKKEMLGYSASLVFLIVSIIVFFTKLPISTLLAKILASVAAIFFMVTLMKRTDDLFKISRAFFEDEQHTLLMLLILMWAGALFTVSTMGIRFIMILAPSVAIASGVFLGNVIHATKEIYPKAAPFVGGLLVILVLSQFVPGALAIGRGSGPSMNHEWHDTLTWIKENTPQETTTISWWDPGHWVTAITQRHSGADGAHYGGGPRPLGYRLEDFGYMFTATNETESLARMANYLGDAEELYLISSGDLMGKFVWLSYFSTGERLSYIMAGKSQVQPQGNELLHIYPIAENVMVVISDQDGQLTPWLYQGNQRQKIRRMAFYQNNQLQEVDYREGFDAMVWVQSDMGMVIFMVGSVKDNMLTRTFLFNGAGLEHLELVHQSPQIKLYRVYFD